MLKVCKFYRREFVVYVMSAECCLTEILHTMKELSMLLKKMLISGWVWGGVNYPMSHKREGKRQFHLFIMIIVP